MYVSYKASTYVEYKFCFIPNQVKYAATVLL